MKRVKGKMVDPYRNKDGTWSTRLVDHEVDILHEDRKYEICTTCTFTSYPKCMETCPNAKLSEEQGLYNTLR